MKAVDALREAQTWFLNTHWTQGQYTVWNDAQQKQLFCPVGALRAATEGEDGGGFPIDAPATVWAENGEYVLALSYLAEQAVPEALAGIKDALSLDDESNVETVENAVIAWNDKPDRTRVEIIAAFEEAINAASLDPADA